MDEQAEREKRKIHRSPSYPVFALEDAIAKAKQVYDSEKRSSTTAEVIASHLGYSQATGPGGRAVSALRQFGLLEENAGKYRISDLGFTLIHFDTDSAEWRKAINDASRRPTLFRELMEEYPDGLPSDATLKNELLRRGFNPSAISDAVSIFRETMALVGSDVNVYDGDVTSITERPQSDLSGASEQGNRSTGVERFTQRNNVQPQISTPVGTNDGEVIFAHVRFDAGIKKEFVSSLKKYLDYLETTLS